ncbi:glycosyltransferase family 4 protein [Armatimonas sp.]|uniref:glycosyltransferase family 4 protein n=1 Tax=Armatimonas sp. TaxID=1872638 RepID=UPI0037524136
MKRILFIQSQTFYGADSAIHAQLMEHLDRHKVEVSVACNHRCDANREMTVLDRLKKIPSLTVRPTEFGPTVFGRPLLEKLLQSVTHGPLIPLHLLSLAAYIKREKIKIIHGTEKPRDAFYGVLLAKLTGARSVIHMHVRYADWLQPTVRWALRNADAVVGVSEFVSRTVIEAGVPAERVHTVVNALDTHDGTWEPRGDAAQVRQEFGIAPDAMLIGVCSRLFRWKGQRELIKATALILPELPNLHLMIVGEDDSRANPGGGSFRAELEELVAQHGMTDNVTFTGFRQDIPRLMNAFDLYAMPSFEEPLGMVYLEAMALGKPVVAYNNGGVPEIVADGITGFLTKPYDIDALARSLRTLALDSGLRQTMGAAARERVLQDNTSKQMCAQMERVYRAVLTGCREPEAIPAIN